MPILKRVPTELELLCKAIDKYSRYRNTGMFVHKLVGDNHSGCVVSYSWIRDPGPLAVYTREIFLGTVKASVRTT